MSEETKTKRVRRGVSNETRSTSQLRFHERDANPNNGLFIGHLEEVTVDFRTLGDDVKGLQSFAGLSIPRLVFHFTSEHASADDRRHVYQTLLPVESNVDTIPGGDKEWQVNNVLAWIKYILDLYVFKGRPMTEEEEDKLTLNFCDYDDEGNYLAVEGSEVIAAYQTLFENAAAILNGEDGKPTFKTADGKPIKVWMKLLRYVKRKNEWNQVAPNGELGFGSFIGEGVLELVKGTNPPQKLKVDTSKESITPKETRKAPNIGGAGIPGAGIGMPGIGGVQAPFGGGAPAFGGGSEDAFNQAGSDVPF